MPSIGDTAVGSQPGLQLGLVPDAEHRVPDRRRAGHRLADDVHVQALRPDDRLDLVVDPGGVRRQLEQQVRAAPGRQAGRLAQRGEQRVDRVRLHRADDDGGHLAALHQRDRDLGVLGAGGAHVGVEDAQRVFLAAHQRRPLDHRDRPQRRLLAQVQPLDRPAAGIGQRLDDRRRPDADRVEQGDHRRRGLEVGARGREVLADRLRRRAGDDQVADVAVDDLAALVDLGGDAFHDRGGGEIRPLRTAWVSSKSRGLFFAVARAPGLRTAMSAWPLLRSAGDGGAA